MPFDPFSPSSASAGHSRPGYSYTPSARQPYTQPQAFTPSTYNPPYNPNAQSLQHHASPTITAYTLSPYASPLPTSYTPLSTPGATAYSYSSSPTPSYSTPYSAESPPSESYTPSEETRRFAISGRGGLELLNNPQDPTARPDYTYKTLCEYALRGSPSGKLTINEIYKAVEARFPSLQRPEHQMTWRNSARHDMSRDRRFKQTARPILEPGRGAYWYFDPSEPTEKRARSKTIDDPLKQEGVPTPRPVIISASKKSTQPISSSRRGSTAGDSPAQGRAAAVYVATDPLWQTNPYMPTTKGQTVSSKRQSNPYLPDGSHHYTQAIGPDYSVRYQPYTRRSSQAEYYN